MKVNDLRAKLCMLALVTYAAATPVLAAKYVCGVFLDDNDKPEATGQFDSAGGQRTLMQAGEFVGFVQVNGQKSGNDEAKMLLIGTAARDNTLAVAAYPDESEMMLGLLQLGSGKQAITTCVIDGKQLIRPASF